jgi:hypothetical protein
MNPKPYFETVRDVYVTAARSLYKAAIEADFETADPGQYLARANEMRNLALETWPLTTRQEMDLGRLRAQAELNTPEGREHRDRIVAKLRGQS